MPELSRKIPTIKRNQQAALALLVLLLTVVILLPGGSAAIPEVESTIVSAERLEQHGIDLVPLPVTASSAIVSAATARVTARNLVGAAKDPEETFRVFASTTYDGPKQSAWLFLFAGGTGSVSGGPFEGSESRAFSVKFTGVLIDDQTGEVMRWFRGGTFTH